MLSVAIPVYNVAVAELVRALADEITRKQLPIEIVLIDDCSNPDIKAQNEPVCAPYTYIQLPQNVGRARIRNLFVQYARYDYLLFLDCDSLIDSPDFLEIYLHHIEIEKPDVVCGGRRYPARCPSHQMQLSWRYGRECESRSATQRNQQPNRSFMTNNFVIRKALLQAIPFDDRLAAYGHEDTLLGFRLTQRHVFIQHIDNEIVNDDIETNPHFLAKSETAIQNLCYILDFIEDKPQFIETVTLLRYAHQLETHPAKLRLIKTLFCLTKPLLKWSLTHGFVSLTLFNFYKLGYYQECCK
jgi:glycosyltransferase involved in cell wall biosynthesis